MNFLGVLFQRRPLPALFSGIDPFPAFLAVSRRIIKSEKSETGSRFILAIFGMVELALSDDEPQVRSWVRLPIPNRFRLELVQRDRLHFRRLLLAPRGMGARRGRVMRGRGFVRVVVTWQMFYDLVDQPAAVTAAVPSTVRVRQR